MGTHTITDKVMAKVNRMFKGPDKDRTIEALESGKTIHIGAVKLRGVKVDKKPAPAAPPANTKMSDSVKKDK